MSRRTLVAANAALALALISGCGSGSGSAPMATAPVIASSPAPVAQSVLPEALTTVPSEVGTSGELIPMQSDNVRSAGYDDATGTMTVLFDSGGLYEYYDVPPSLWVDFVAAQPHPWSAVGDPRLVKGGIAYKRIG